MYKNDHPWNTFSRWFAVATTAWTAVGSGGGGGDHRAAAEAASPVMALQILLGLNRTDHCILRRRRLWLFLDRRKNGAARHSAFAFLAPLRRGLLCWWSAARSTRAAAAAACWSAARSTRAAAASACWSAWKCRSGWDATHRLKGR